MYQQIVGNYFSFFFHLGLTLLSFSFFSTTWGASNLGEQPSLILSIPDDTDFPREQLNLSIHLPGKIKPSQEAKELSRSIIKRRFDFVSHPLDEISDKSRFQSIMTRFVRKGILTQTTDKRLATGRAIKGLTVQAARVIIVVYNALLKIEARKELRKFQVKASDIEDLKELVDEFQKELKMFTYTPTEMQTNLDRIMESANKTTGKGTIRITGVSESDDGTLINLYIRKD
mgnify:FL=1